MKVGVNLINFGPSARPETLRRWAQLAEGLGYHHLMTSDHIAVTPDMAERYPAPLYEPLSTLGWLAGVTERIGIGSTVIILPYRHPLEVARAAANIDRLSGGRFILGVGAGWSKQEFAALGVPVTKRGAIANEYLEVIKLAWTNEVASFDGEFVSFADVQTAPLPAQTPHPPIWVGGRSDGAIRRAVRYGDGWHPFRLDLPWFRDTGVPALKRSADEEGRPVPALCPRIMLHILESPLPEDGRRMGEGSLDQIRADLEALYEMGCAHVVLDTYHDDVDATRDPVQAWAALTVMAEKVLDLEQESLR